MDMASVGHIDETSGLQGEVEEENMEEEYGIVSEGDRPAETSESVDKVDGENLGEVGIFQKSLSFHSIKEKEIERIDLLGPFGIASL
jgi:hypothetical protein